MKLIKHYVDSAGNYLGGFNVEPPKGSIEVEGPPPHGDQKWNGYGWDPLVIPREVIERLRLAAYADPFTGSDRFKAEADAERLAGNEDAAAIAEQKLLARREEIKSQYPWPEK